MLSLLRPQNTSLAAGNRIPEILVLGLRLHGKNASVPTDVVELIAMQRKSGMLFACVRDAEIDGTVQKECAFAVRRALPGRAGHTPTFKVFASAWVPADEALLDISDPAVDSMDTLWESLCAQVILGDSSPAEVDARMVRNAQIAQLKADIDKLTRDLTSGSRIQRSATKSSQNFTRRRNNSRSCRAEPSTRWQLGE